MLHHHPLFAGAFKDRLFRDDNLRAHGVARDGHSCKHFRFQATIHVRHGRANFNGARGRIDHIADHADRGGKLDARVGLDGHGRDRSDTNPREVMFIHIRDDLQTVEIGDGKQRRVRSRAYNLSRCHIALDHGSRQRAAQFEP